MELELFPNVASVSVENFLTLVDNKFYDGLTMENFIIQGGCSTDDAVDSIIGEFPNDGGNNNLYHLEVLSQMARTEDSSIMLAVNSLFSIKTHYI